MIDTSLHRRILLNILKDIYQDKHAATWLGLKGGTALYFFHELTRFSVDLDFDLLVSEDIFMQKKIQFIVEKYMVIKDYSEKKNTFFWLGSYKETHRNVKVEISRRRTEDEYELFDLYGISVNCMKKAYLFANKLCAIHDRYAMANRDIFDAHFMFSKQFPVAESVIEARTGMKTREYFALLTKYVPKHVSAHGIVQGMGELLSADQKRFAKERLLKELLFYLKSF